MSPDDKQTRWQQTLTPTHLPEPKTCIVTSPGQQQVSNHHHHRVSNSLSLFHKITVLYVAMKSQAVSQPASQAN